MKAEEFEVEELHSDEESPSKPADNILLVNGRTVYFTREQDREILLAVATTADSATQGARLRELATSGKLGNKTEAEIAQRYQQLLELQQRARRKS